MSSKVFKNEYEKPPKEVPSKEGGKYKTCLRSEKLPQFIGISPEKSDHSEYIQLAIAKQISFTAGDL